MTDHDKEQHDLAERCVKLIKFAKKPLNTVAMAAILADRKKGVDSSMIFRACSHDPRLRAIGPVGVTTNFEVIAIPREQPAVMGGEA